MPSSRAPWRTTTASWPMAAVPSSNTIVIRTRSPGAKGAAGMKAKPPAERSVRRPGTRVPGARWRARTATATSVRVTRVRGFAASLEEGSLIAFSIAREADSRIPRRTTTSRSASLEGDLDRLAVGGILDLEELAAGEAERAGEQAVREHLDLGVVRLDVAVVDAARSGDLVLGVRQLALQLGEALGGAQLRVGLGDREQAAQRAGERTLRLAGFRPGRWR